MYIHSIDDPSIIKKARNGDKFIELELKLEPDDYVFIDGVFYEYSSHLDKEYIIRKSDMVDLVSEAEIEILKALLFTYREQGNINETLSAFENLSMDQFCKSLSDLITCVKRHEKITDKEAVILFDLLSGKKTKKQILDERICTYEELKKAFGEFAYETQWCYGYKKPYLEHRIKAFSEGELQFLWTAQEFMEKYNVSSSMLENILAGIVISTKLLEENNRTWRLRDLLSAFLKNKISPSDKTALAGLETLVSVRFDQEIESQYLSAADCLISENKTHISDIGEFSRKTGYCEYKICRAMRKRGTEPDYHKRRPMRYIGLTDSLLDDYKVFIISGPSCSRKAEICKEFMKLDLPVVRTVSDTTRMPRPDEQDGVDYNFISEEEFKKRLSEGEYVEHTLYDHKYYGTRYDCFFKAEEKAIVMNIDVNGAKLMRRRAKNAVTIFILPDSVDEMMKRLIAMGYDTVEDIERKLIRAKKEIKDSVLFDYVVTTENIEDAIAEVTDIILTNL